MPIEIVVALVGDPAHAFETVHTAVPDIERDRPYAERVSATLTVEEDARLEDLLSRAADQLDVQAPEYADSVGEALARVAFYLPSDDVGGSGRWLSELTLLDENGHARWGVRFKGATIGEVIAAADAGVLAGDPRRPYLILAPGHGNGMLPTWSALLVGLDILWKVMQGVATAEGVLSFGKRIVSRSSNRIRDGHAALESNYLTWAERGGRPDTLADTLGQRPWNSADLAAVLGCPVGEAEALLWAFGYAQAESGLWRRDADDEARLVRTAVEDINLTYGTNPTEFERLLHARAHTLLETGEPPPDPYEEYEVEDEPLDPEDFDTPIEEGLVIPCACGRDECVVRAEVFQTYPELGGGAHLRLRIDPPSEHFVIDPFIVAVILGRMAQ